MTAILNFEVVAKIVERNDSFIAFLILENMGIGKKLGL